MAISVGMLTLVPTTAPVGPAGADAAAPVGTPGFSVGSAVAVTNSAVHVVFGTVHGPGESRESVFYRRTIDRGVTWSDPVRLARFGSGGAVTSVDIAASSDRVYAVYDVDTATGARLFFVRSTDGGATWSEPVRLATTAGERMYPAIAVDGGTVHVVWEDDATGAEDIYYRRSGNAGGTWERRVAIARGTGEARSPDIAADGGFAVVVWSDDRGGEFDIYQRASDDGGAVWDRRGRIVRTAAESIHPALSIAGGDVHLVWADSALDEGRSVLLYVRHVDGITLPRVRLTPAAYLSSLPELVATGDKVHLVWADALFSDGGGPPNVRIFYRRSDDRGAGWGLRMRLTPLTGYRIPVQIDSGTQGLHLTLLDDTGVRPESYHMGSLDRGRTWIGPVRIS